MPAEVTSGPSVNSPRPFAPPSEREQEAPEAKFTTLWDADWWLELFTGRLLKSPRELTWRPIFGWREELASLDFRTGGSNQFWVLTVEGEPVEITDEHAGPTAHSVSTYRLISDEPVERWDLESFMKWSPTPTSEGQITASLERAERPPMEWEF